MNKYDDARARWRFYSADFSRNATTDYNVQAHHEDYDKPLEILWLCGSCHQKHHCQSPASTNYVGTPGLSRAHHPLRTNHDHNSGQK